ncbi:ABC transporter ATP-binding protein/permease [Frigoribacterium sp. RIT-PI-h]|uniref:ABC transporter ATP-binding protein/permease n=1 Tax=Frigoribacterium sp. RIT-PI-h TaxID=1690245 RepID=UPI000ABBE948|nr:ABC transporter transmembrane domain-containing protein [Frigoribacterium sp. RIT-PI-h]
MKPLDPRLLRYASAARVFLGLGAVLGLAQTVAIVAVAWFTTTAVVQVVEGSTSGLSTALLGLGVSVAARSLVAWALEVTAARAAAQVKSQLRSRVVRAVADRGRAWVDRHSSARVATLVGPGLDALDEYFSRYLPQLVLTALATPLLIVVMALHDWLSALIVVVTLPLIPVFMVLIGWTTRAAQNRQWDRLTHLASSFADAVGGASTLKAFGRERRQVERIGRLTDDYRVETVKVLRVSFLSGFVLELAASLSVALVAVSIGIRLVEGSMGLTAGLFVLLLTPEAYLPLRQVGAHYHAAADGVAAAEDVFELLDDEPGDVAPRPTGPTGPTGATAVADRAQPRAEADALVVDRVSVSRGGAARLAETSFVAETGRVTAVVGPSGAGTSTLLDAVPGLDRAGAGWCGVRRAAPPPATRSPGRASRRRCRPAPSPSTSPWVTRVSPPPRPSCAPSTWPARPASTRRSCSGPAARGCPAARRSGCRWPGRGTGSSGSGRASGWSTSPRRRPTASPRPGSSRDSVASRPRASPWSPPRTAAP